MKKYSILTAAVLVALVALGAAGLAYAQGITPSPDTPSGTIPFYGQGFGRGMMRGQGFGMGMMGTAGTTYGPMHEYMLPALAEALGLTPDELQARLDAGDTVWTVAEEQGMTLEAFGELMTAARTSALEQMVVDGVITQDQADWMLERMASRPAAGTGFGCTGVPGSGGLVRGGRWGR